MERGGGHLMPLMSKLGARVNSGLQKKKREYGNPFCFKPERSK